MGRPTTRREMINQVGGVPPLTGFTVAITAERRREELAELLRRRGARVRVVSTLRTVFADDAEIAAATEEALTGPVDIVIVTTAVGFRRWLESADGLGYGDRLRMALWSADLVARGAKARGAVRAAGLPETSPPVETMSEIVEFLRARGVCGKRVVVQAHGDPDDRTASALCRDGAEVVVVPVYHWSSADAARAERLAGDIVTGRLDAVVFTSRPACDGLLRASGDAREHVIDAFRAGVVAACIGPVCAQPLVDAGVDVVMPPRGRLGDLVRAVTEEVPRRRTLSTAIGNQRLEVRGHGVVYGEAFTVLPPAPLAVLRALVANAGRVVTKSALAAAIGTAVGRQQPSQALKRLEHRRVEMAVARLRRAVPHIPVTAVIKRGYRLAQPGSEGVVFVTGKGDVDRSHAPMPDEEATPGRHPAVASRHANPEEVTVERTTWVEEHSAP